MAFRKLLCPIDFSPGSRHALNAAVRIASQLDAELVVAHVWTPIPPPVFVGEYIVPPHVTQDVIDGATRGLEAAVADATRSGARRVSGVLRSGTAWAEIVHLLDQSFDLVVIGTHGRTGLARFLLGSVAEKVIRHSPCCVLAIRMAGDPDQKPGPFVHALCATDFSQSSRDAMTHACELVAPAGRISLLHAVEVPMAYLGEAPSLEFAQDLERRSATHLDEWAVELRETFPQLVVTTDTSFGSAAAQILAAIEADASIDLVVTGSHGRTGIKRVLLGSIAEKVVRHARCPVLVTRERK